MKTATTIPTSIPTPDATDTDDAAVLALLADQLGAHPLTTRAHPVDHPANESCCEPGGFLGVDLEN